MSLEQDIQEIKERNARVEADKAWETSWARSLTIAAFTYLIAGVWLVMIRDTRPLLKALIPAIGFLLSTFSLPLVKSWWIRRHYFRGKMRVGL